MNKKRKTGYFYAIMSVALVLFLLGFCLTILLFIRQKAVDQQAGVKMMVELKDGADSTSLTQIKLTLPKEPFVKSETFEFVSREKAFDEMQKWFGDDLITADMPIPFSDAYRFSLKEGFDTPESIESTIASLKENPAVNDAFINESFNEEISTNLQRVVLYALGIALLFVIVALTLIHNTIRLNLYSDRFIIKNMELVGASWGFITYPYIKRSIRNGLISSILALVGIAIVWYFIQKDIPELNKLFKSPVFWGGVMGLVATGVVITWLSTYFVVNKYLKMRLDDLY